ncbi:hypothetical protein [Hungatella effluvii]|uniref:hypothetical protein n=1 Tax=Hungatella effluvii TaxID=1096246 RepID=UPI002A82BCF9|nr:hypothetical protein [Hungatella effluvii]
MARPNKTDEALLVSILEKYYADVACGNAGDIRFTDLAKYAEGQGVPAKEYEFRRNKGVRRRLDELKAGVSGAGAAAPLVYKSIDADGLVRTCRDLSDLKGRLSDMDAYWKSVYDRYTEMETDYRNAVSRKAESEKQAGLMKKEMQRSEELYQESEKENRELRRENAYLRRMLEKYLYPDLARQLMQEAHLPARTAGNVTQAALDELIEGVRPAPFSGAQKAREKPKTREEQLLDEMRRQAEE